MSAQVFNLCIKWCTWSPNFRICHGGSRNLSCCGLVYPARGKTCCCRICTEFGVVSQSSHFPTVFPMILLKRFTASSSIQRAINGSWISWGAPKGVMGVPPLLSHDFPKMDAIGDWVQRAEPSDGLTAVAEITQWPSVSYCFFESIIKYPPFHLNFCML